MRETSIVGASHAQGEAEANPIVVRKGKIGIGTGETGMNRAKWALLVDATHLAGLTHIEDLGTI